MLAPLPDDRAEIGRILFEQRRRKGLRQSEVAVAAGISIRTLREYETGRHPIPVPRRPMLAQALGLDPSALGYPTAKVYAPLPADKAAWLALYDRHPRMVPPAHREVPHPSPGARAMLTCTDLSGFDLSDLGSRLQSMALRQDRYRREAESIGITCDMPATHRLVAQARADLDTLVDLERLVDTLRQSRSEAVERRPAPVLQLVPRSEPDPVALDPVKPAPRLGMIGRLRLAMRQPAARAKVA